MGTVFYLLMGFWFASEIYFAIALKSKKNEEKKSDKSTLSILWIVISLSIFISIFFSFSTTKFRIANSEWIQYLGLFLICTGILFRFVIVKSLGKFFTVDVTIRAEHQLKKDGFYAIIRHPSYFLSLITFLGLGIFLNNWVGLAIAFIPTLIAFIYRIKIEEDALINHFGKEYLNYKKNTKKIIPYIY